MLWAFSAALSFTIVNAMISEITGTVGPLVLLYNCSGSLVAGLGYNLFKAYQNYKQNGVFWSNQNIVIKGKLKVRHLLAFVVYCCLLVAARGLVYLTIYFATAADVNVGVITTIWSVDPVFLAIVDYLVFG